MGLHIACLIAIFGSLLLLGTFAVPGDGWVSSGKGTKSKLKYGAKDDNHATILVPEDGFIIGLRLTRESGTVNCYIRDKSRASNWGCIDKNNKGKIGILVTDTKNQILWPYEMADRQRWKRTFVYSGGNGPNDKMIQFYNFLTPSYHRINEELHLYYGEDYYKHANEKDNGGEVTFTAEFLYRPM